VKFWACMQSEKIKADHLLLLIHSFIIIIEYISYNLTLTYYIAMTDDKQSESQPQTGAVTPTPTPAAPAPLSFTHLVLRPFRHLTPEEQTRLADQETQRVEQQAMAHYKASADAPEVLEAVAKVRQQVEEAAPTYPLPVEPSSLRLSRHVIMRQAEPMLCVRTEEDLPDALREVESNLHTLGGIDPSSILIGLARLDPHGLERETMAGYASKIEQRPLWTERAFDRIKQFVTRGKVTGGSTSVAVAAADASSSSSSDSDAMIPPGGVYIPTDSTSLTLPTPSTVHCLGVVFREKNRTGGNFGLMTDGRGGADTQFHLVLNNPMFGHGETLSLTLSKSLSDMYGNEADIIYRQADLLTKKSQNAFRLYRHRRDYSLASSYAEQVFGLGASWGTRDGRHELSYDIVNRKLEPQSTPLVQPSSLRSRASRLASMATSALGKPHPSVESVAAASTSTGQRQWREPSPSILAAIEQGRGAGHSVKSALKYSFNHNRLDHPLVPTSGYALKASTELAGLGGLGGDAKFVKLTTDAKYFVPLHKHASLGFSLLGGYLHHLSPLTPRAYISDRFFLGTPMTLRGFEAAAAGPRDGLDALGGELSLAGSISCSFNMPVQSLRQQGIRGNVFWNAGNLIGLQRSAQVKQPPPTATTANNSISSPPFAPHDHALLPHNASFSSIASSFLSSTRQSVGVGLSCSVGPGRLEFNLAHPIRLQPHDQRKGWPIEFGIGVEWA